VQKSTLDMAGASRLDQIRASMAGEQLASAPPKPAVESGTASGTPAAGGPKDASVSRLDEIRANLAKDKAPGDAASAG